MWRIPIFGTRMSDVTDMRVKGWQISIYKNGRGTLKGVTTTDIVGNVTMSKNRVQFVLKQVDQMVYLYKLVDNVLVSESPKHYQADGSEGCEGTIFINDHSNPEKCYAFWRSKELQSLMDSCGIDRLSFSKSNEETFDYAIPITGEGYDFLTDGSVTKEVESNVYKIFNASYLCKPAESTLMLSQKYDINKVSKQLIADMYKG